MRTVKGLSASGVATIMLGAMLAAGTVSAQERFTTESPGSILIFPKVINTNGRQTVIQITNTTNMPRFAHCFYINGQIYAGQQLCTVTDFEISLTRQQPTSWAAGVGRSINPMDAQDGIDPGAVPPVPPGFTGALICVEVNSGGDPTDSNPFKGEATTGEEVVNAGVEPHNASKYNAVAVEAVSGANNGDNVLELDNTEYAACPTGGLLNFAAESGPDLVFTLAGNDPSVVSTTLAVVPCSIDLQNLIPATTLLNFETRNEFEGARSALVPVTCWGALNLDDAEFLGTMTPAGLGSLFGFSQITGSPLGFVAVANATRVGANGASDAASTNLHFFENSFESQDLSSAIRLPSLP